MLKKLVRTAAVLNAAALGGGASLGLYALAWYLYLLAGLNIRRLEAAAGALLDPLMFAVVRLEGNRSLLVFPAVFLILMIPGGLAGVLLHARFRGQPAWRIIALVERCLFLMGLVCLALIFERLVIRR